MTGHRPTHSRRRELWTLGVALAGALSLSACGGHAAGAGNLTIATPTPIEAVTRAVEALAGAPFRMHATQTVDIDRTGIPAGAEGDAPPVSDIHQTISGGAENAQRFSGTFAYGNAAAVRIVLYDGAGYASGDGTSWREAPLLSAMVSQLGVQQLEDMTKQISSIHDAGRVRVDGVDSERYDAAFPASSFNSLGRQLATGMAGALGVPTSVIDATLTALHVDSFTIGFDIARTTGRLVAAIGSGNMSIDLARMAAALGIPATADMTGTIRIRESSDERITNQGGHIVVQRPASSGTMTAQEFDALLTSGVAG